MLNTFQQAFAKALKETQAQTCMDLLAQCEDLSQLNFDFALIDERRIVTPLHLACENKALLPVAQVLINCGAKLEAVDDKGRTPLICAAIARNEGAVSLLLNHDANVKAMDYRGNYAKDFAECPRDDVICELLAQKSGPKLFSILAQSSERDKLNVDLLPTTVKANLKAEQQRQSEHQAAKNLCESTFQYNLQAARKKIKVLL